MCAVARLTRGVPARPRRPRACPPWLCAEAVPEAFPGAAGPSSIRAAGQPTHPSRHPAGQGSRPRPRTRVLLVATAVVALAGVAATYVVMSGGSATGKSVGSSQQIGAADQSQVPALTGTGTHAPGQRPSRFPGAHATSPTAAQDTPSTAPIGSPSARASSAATATQTTPAGTPGTPGPTGPNLVADGDFSESTLSAWNHQNFNTAVVSSGRDGGRAAQMTGQPTAGVAQIVTGLKPGTEYELTGWIYSGTGGYSTYVGVKAYDGTSGVSRALKSTNTWSEVTMVFTPGSGHTTAEVFCWQAVAGTGDCTDVSLHALS